MTTNKQAARNAMSLLKAFTSDGKFDHKGFLNEMQVRAEQLGATITPEQYGTLGQMVAIYVEQYSLD